MRSIVLVLTITACGSSESPSDKPAALQTSVPAKPTSAVELPDVAPAGYAPADAVDAAVVATPAAIVVDGASIVTLHDGVVDPADKRNGALDLVIPRLAAAGGNLAARRTPSPLYLAVDRRLTYGLLIELLFSLKQRESGWKRFAILAKHGDHLLSVPITLPDRPRPSAAAARGGADLAGQIQAAVRSRVHPGSADKPDPVLTRKLSEMDRKLVEALEQTSTDGAVETAGVGVRDVDNILAGPSGDSDQAVKLVVSVTNRDILVWSISGLEGTLKEPKLSVARADPTAPAKVSATLVEIVRRRWPSQRPETTREIMVMMERATPMQQVSEIFGAVRATPDGVVLFPDLLLGSGFE